ncbi:MAG: hypothetical protein JO332_09685 [Planctomycetaceae bacterium]|nr:hypothetical protein [Planctomycetaceae bacterium]
MSLAVSLLLPLLGLQAEAPSFSKDGRVTAAYYYLLPGAKPETDFLEMEKAGIDVALVDFAGDPQALDPLVAALDALVKQKKETPRLGVYLKPGAKVDLGAADAFYDRVPKRHAARVDGRLLLWLGPAPANADGLDEAVQRLREPPFLVAEVSWKGKPDRSYALGALRGFALDLPVVSVSPGTLDREDGKTYERNWYKAVRLEPRMVVLESWNGAADGVAETPERKRKYLDLTHRFTRDYKVNEKIVLPKGKWTAATQVAYTSVYNPHEEGLKPVATEEGLFDTVKLRGFEGLSTKENKKGPVRRLCFDVDDSFCYFETRSFMVAVEFLDLGEGAFSLEYDSGDRTLPAEQRVVKSAGSVRYSGTGSWKTETFRLPDAAFGNGQPGGSDFRLSIENRGLAVRSVMVLKQ